MLKNMKEKVRNLINMNYLIHNILVNVVGSYGFRFNVPTKYPTDLNIELTTICNAKCVYCTHEDLIKSGHKIPKHLNYEFAKYIIDKLREITQDVPEKEIRITPVGLGEPLLYPYFFEVVAYIRKLFPSALIHANTNCIALSNNVQEKLIESSLDVITLSINFNDAKTYREQFGVDKYDQVLKNIQQFLLLKGERSPMAIVQIFDVTCNRKSFPRFVREWAEYINKNDRITVRKFIDFKAYSRKKAKYVCPQLWSVLTVDVEGYVYPCCIAVWIPKCKDLCLGHITEDTSILLHKAEEIRKRHIEGKYGICQNCAVLYSYPRIYMRRFYKKIQQSPCLIET